jgi:hypothetical protein
MCGLSSKFSNAHSVINAMNPLLSFLWVHSYLLQEETRVERSHKMEVANTLLAAGASAGAPSGTAAAAMVATDSSYGAPKPPAANSPRCPPKVAIARSKSSPMDGLAPIPDLPRLTRCSTNSSGVLPTPGPAWFRPGRSLPQTGELRPAVRSTTGHLKPCWPRRLLRRTPSSRRPTSSPPCTVSCPPPRLTPAVEIGSLTPVRLHT